MILITGKYNTAKIYTDELENSARGQIQKLLDLDFVEGSQIRIMPDVHAGAGCTIGTTLTITDKVVPNLVGVDIGCGMETVKLSKKRINLPELDSFIHNHIPSGFEIRKEPHKHIGETRLDELRCSGSVDIRRGKRSLGTLGGGNHFIEIDKDNDDSLYLVVHSGSRKLGLQVAEFYQDLAFKSLGEQTEIPFELAYCEGELFDDYIHDMAIMQEFANINRRAIVDDILKGCKLKEEYRFSTIHNYIDLDNMLLRKGAVSAQAEEMLLIPLNMRDGSLICEGKGNPDWNCSAPHGAGRIMSRGDAKRSFTLSSYKKEMTGIFSTSINDDTLDECPMAYKNMDNILTNIEPTAKVIDHIKPIYNFKASEQKGKRRKGGRRTSR
jgi:RNA-splicing ligase RtcB